MGKFGEFGFELFHELLSVLFNNLGTAVCGERPFSARVAWVLIKWEALALPRHLRAALTGVVNRLTVFMVSHYRRVGGLKIMARFGVGNGRLPCPRRTLLFWAATTPTDLIEYTAQ